MGNGTAYDPETVQLLRAVLDEAWDALAPRHREQISKSHVAQCVLRRAAAGERHPGAPATRCHRRGSWGPRGLAGLAGIAERPRTGRPPRLETSPIESYADRER